jgi:hypothetical protein
MAGGCYDLKKNERGANNVTDGRDFRPPSTYIRVILESGIIWLISTKVPVAACSI